ncbi:hypothetical protein HC248_00204 [Polaromonas vacuolata]|uniref:Flagellin n=1 Tax=Polaromonas vacuolata TaxID=37448 RepID=A0A6H2H4Z1_9BURK|nr:hypothetical protein [Polaromonas vacuolata]QJC54941.1 hypothetical protein HC248_00204 [Polaromonas vacuolata]
MYLEKIKKLFSKYLKIERNYMTSVNSATVNSMMTVDISQLSIEDAIYVVNMNRMKNAEDRVTIKMTEAQARNVELANLNSTYAALQNLSSGFPANSSPTTKVDKISGWTDGGYAKEQKSNDVLEDAGLRTSTAGLGLTGNGINSEGKREVESGKQGNGIDSNTTKLQIDNAMTTLKSRIDNLASISQTDMIELLSATGKYTASTDATSGNMKKFQEQNEKIQSNINR